MSSSPNPPIVAGSRVMFGGGKRGTVIKPAVTRRGWGKTLFVEIKTDDGKVEHVWRNKVLVIS